MFYKQVSHVVIGRLVLRGHLDAVGQEAEDGTDPEQDGEPSEQLTAKLDPLRRGGGRGQRVWTVPGQNLHSSSVGQTLREKIFCFFLGMNVFPACAESLITTQPHFYHSLKSNFTATVAEHQVFLPGLFNTTSIINWVMLPHLRFYAVEQLDVTLLNFFSMILCVLYEV